MNSIMWFRHDLRISDNPALNLAVLMTHLRFPSSSSTLNSTLPRLYPIYIINTNHHYSVPQQKVLFSALTALSKQLADRLTIFQGDPRKIIPQLAKILDTNSVVCTGDFTPMGSADFSSIIEQNIPLLPVCSPYLLPLNKVVKNDGTPYRIFTPFSRQWKEYDYLNPFKVEIHNSEIKIPFDIQLRYICELQKIDYAQFAKANSITAPIGKISEQLSNILKTMPDNPTVSLVRQLQSKLFSPAQINMKTDSGDDENHLYETISEIKALDKLENFIDYKLDCYEEERDYPALASTSQLSVDLAYGTIHPRQIFDILNSSEVAFEKQEKFITQLIWREFAGSILFHFPETAWENMNPSFADFKYSQNHQHFQSWCEGKTGVPIIDAAMNQLNRTGCMPNRLRMLTASFLTKDLLIPWQWGAEYFLERLIDADFANNQLGWQWCAGTGTDASPFFRIFNPFLQAKKFDPQACYIKTWIPQLKDVSAKLIHSPTGSAKVYIAPIVDHKIAREIALEHYRNR